MQIVDTEEAEKILDFLNKNNYSLTNLLYAFLLQFGKYPTIKLCKREYRIGDNKYIVEIKKED